ncbi:MAG: small multi-drug export protein [Clostridiales bacterium]|nr:small multi-drug export protein [Clostridiales bacterium]
MSAFVQSMADAMSSSLGAPLAVFLLSMIPIAEARFAIPFGMSMGLSPAASFGWAFLGSCMIAPILLIILIPIINALSKTKFFSKIGKFLYDKFEKKSRQVADGDEKNDSDQSQDGKKFKFTKRDVKRMAGTAGFVAIPLPLTGVWTGSAVASITKIGFVKGLVSIIAGNAVACGIITLIGFLFADYVNYITLAFLAIAILVVVFLIVKFIIYKPDASVEDNGNAQDSPNGDKE